QSAGGLTTRSTAHSGSTRAAKCVRPPHPPGFPAYSSSSAPVQDDERSRPPAPAPQALINPGRPRARNSFAPSRECDQIQLGRDPSQNIAEGSGVNVLWMGQFVHSNEADASAVEIKNLQRHVAVWRAKNTQHAAVLDSIERRSNSSCAVNHERPTSGR